MIGPRSNVVTFSARNTQWQTSLDQSLVLWGRLTSFESGSADELKIGGFIKIQYVKDSYRAKLIMLRKAIITPDR